MPIVRYKHQYIHNIPLKKDFDEEYNILGGGLVYPKFPFQWIGYRKKEMVFDINFTMEMQYYLAGGIELNKITNIDFVKYTDNKDHIIATMRDIIGSKEDIIKFYDVLAIEPKSKNRIDMDELFADKVINGRMLCHIFIKLFDLEYSRSTRD